MVRPYLRYLGWANRSRARNTRGRATKGREVQEYRARREARNSYAYYLLRGAADAERKP